MIHESISRCADVAGAQDGLDDAAKAAQGAATPVLSDSRAFDAVQRRHPVFVETAFLGEVGNHRRQKRIEIVCVWLRKGNDAEAIADR